MSLLASDLDPDPFSHPVLVSIDLPSGEDDGSTPWPSVSESTSKRIGRKQPPSSAIQTSPICDPIDCWHSKCTLWLCAGRRLNDGALTSCCTPPPPPRLASFPKSGHNTRPQLCSGDINISARLLSFFAGGDVDSAIRYIKAWRTIKPGVKIRRCVLPSHLFFCHVTFDRRRRLCVWSHRSMGHWQEGNWKYHIALVNSGANLRFYFYSASHPFRYWQVQFHCSWKQRHYGLFEN